MSDQIDELLSNLKEIEPPAGLEARVLERVHAQVRRDKAVLAGGYGLLAITAGFAVVFIQNLVASISYSPLSELVDLLLSDPGAVSTDLPGWLIAILESLPVEQLLYVVATIFIALLLAGGLSGLSVRHKVSSILRNI